MALGIKNSWKYEKDLYIHVTKNGWYQQFPDYLIFVLATWGSCTIKSSCKKRLMCYLRHINWINRYASVAQLDRASAF